MADGAPTTAEFEAALKAIDDLQKAQQKALRENELAFVKKIDALTQTRTAALAKEGVTGKFWQHVLRSHPDLKNDLFGPYDDALLNSLAAMKLTRVETLAVPVKVAGAESQPPADVADGWLLEMSFELNDYFTDKTIWALYRPSAGDDVDDDKVYFTSGVRWKSGRGPEPEDADAGSRASGKKASGEKRGRTEHGPTFLEIFAPMPDYPAPDEDDEDADEEELEEAMEEWLELLKERTEVFKCLLTEVWTNPVAVLEGRVGGGGGDDSGSDEEEDEEDDE